MIDYQKAEDQLTEVAGAEFSSLSSVNTSEISELKGLIDENTVLAEYFRGPSSDTVYLFALDSARMKANNPMAMILKCPDGQLNLKILGFRNLLDSSPDEYSPEIHEQSRELYNILISPFEELIAGKTRLILVPHGNLNFLPFSALENNSGKNLVDMTGLVYLPSANTFRFCREKNPKRYETLLAFAFGDTQTETLSPLPNTLIEVDNIGTFFPADKKTIIKGGSPSLEEFSGKADKKDVIHLAAHGILQPNLPLESSIMLGTIAVPVKEIMTLDLKAGIVTLSACQTGMGKVYEGDEIVGLTRAFMYAGTPSVLSSLWPVSDESTSMLMSEFFKNFKGGKDKAESLRLAQQAVRAKFQSPYHWSSFILTGDWE